MRPRKAVDEIRRMFQLDPGADVVEYVGQLRWKLLDFEANRGALDTQATRHVEQTKDLERQLAEAWRDAADLRAQLRETLKKIPDAIA
jgi:hypothetical protein